MMAQQPQAELGLEHFFVDGLYARAMTIPKGVALTGKIHKRDHLNFLLKGRISVMTDSGMKELTAPQIIPSIKGVKRAGYAHEECVWVTVHATDATDPETAEEELTEPGRPEIEAMKMKVLEGVK
jgi:hypothetical protein